LCLADINLKENILYQHNIIRRIPKQYEYRMVSNILLLLLKDIHARSNDVPGINTVITPINTSGGVATGPVNRGHRPSISVARLQHPVIRMISSELHSDDGTFLAEYEEDDPRNRSAAQLSPAATRKSRMDNDSQSAHVHPPRLHIPSPKRDYFSDFEDFESPAVSNTLEPPRFQPIETPPVSNLFGQRFQTVETPPVSNPFGHKFQSVETPPVSNPLTPAYLSNYIRSELSIRRRSNFNRHFTSTKCTDSPHSASAKRQDEVGKDKSRS